MKKNIFILLLLIGLAALAFIALKKNNQTGTLGAYQKDFYIEDTASITIIYMTKKSGEKILLEREGPGKWKVNEIYEASLANVGILLKTIIICIGNVINI